MSGGPVEQSIRAKLAELGPVRLDVINESHSHNVPPNSETHFKLLIVSQRFAGLNRVNRQQLVYGLLKEELDGPVHALTMRTMTAEEFASAADDVQSPPCRGGGKG